MSDQTNYRKVIAIAIADAMREDPDVFLLGEDVGAAGGAFKTTVGLQEEFGPERVRDTPISEQAIVGAAIGAALCGLRPVAEVMFADFAGVCFDQIANQAAKYRYMTAGQASLPMTIRMANGAGSGFGAQHSQSAENWFLSIPGVRIVVPSTVEDLYLLLRAAIADDNPVLVFEHKSLFALKGSVPTSSTRLELGVADVVRRGSDLTIVASQLMRHRAVEAADRLASEGIDVTVIDPRTLVPFDDETVAESLAQTSRLMVIQEAVASGSWGSSLISRMTQHHFELFDAPPVLLGTAEGPAPYADNLEDAWLPSVSKIVEAARTLVKW